MSKDELSAFINDLAGQIRHTEGVAMKNRELLTHEAVANIEAFLRGQLDIMVSNLRMLAISTPLPAVGSFSIATPIAPVQTAAAPAPDLSRTAAVKVTAPVAEPLSYEKPTARPTPPGRLPRATQKDMEYDKKKVVVEEVTDSAFLTE